MKQAPYKAPDTNSPTPMMAQFLEIKAVNPGYLLFYRMGDFYELFFEDAQIASRALGIVLTKRGKHKDKDIPMCGVPVHASDNYLKKLISLGHKVAVCEQMESPIEAKKRGSKSVVKRDVVRLVSAGTITEDELLPTNSNNFLCSLAIISHEKSEVALAWADISTGEIFHTKIKGEQLCDELSLINATEIIVSQKSLDKIKQLSFLPNNLENKITIIEHRFFDSELSLKKINQTFEKYDASALSRTIHSALGALINYIENAQKTNELALRNPIGKDSNTIMSIDVATRNSLELISTNQGLQKGSLRDVIDLCSTSAGSRLLTRRLLAPLTNIEDINKRLDMVEILFSDNIFRDELQKNIRSIPDISRALTRLTLDRSGPRDLANLGIAIEKAVLLSEIISKKSQLPTGIKDIISTLNLLPKTLGQKLALAFIDEPPIHKKDGGFIEQNYNEELDKQRKLTTKSRAIISALQLDLSQETKIKNLKIKHNRVLGYFIEVPISQGEKLLSNEFNSIFIHRQTMANVMRFTTSDLAKLESEISLAQANSLKIELDIFSSLRNEIIAKSKILQKSGDALAKLDLSISLAKLAAQRNYCRPKIDNSLAFNIIGARHPVVEQTLKENNENFIINDCDLSGEGGANEEENGGQLWLVTGPNMGGKSTFLRQNALIAILAQIGSFVPANSAHIGIVDKVFSRVGASDDIAKGRSTFMVEMVETAAILNYATKRSLVILDEIGRGTSTFDGLSIAWATAEALNKRNRSRALFATHFHELTSLAKILDRTSNHTMNVREYRGELVFLHQVSKGTSDRSYGIQVAKLAGLPQETLQRAKEVLSLLEKQPRSSASLILDELPLFSHSINIEKNEISKIDEMLDNLRPDELTPLKAVELLYELKRIYDGNK